MKLHSSSVRRGFTLIELLVVIAIIGILSSVVLASLNTARAKGVDAAIKSNLNSIRPQSSMMYDTLGGTYNNTGVAISSATCSTLTDVGTIFEDVTIQNALIAAALAAGSDSDCGVSDIGDSYSIATALKTGGFWCIDNTGIARGTTAAGVPYDAVSATTDAAHAASGDAFCQ